MSKKANLRQEQIVTLTDYHREEIHQIHRDQKSMLQQYDEKKQGLDPPCSVPFDLLVLLELRRQLLGKEQRLVQVNEDLETMRGYQVRAPLTFHWFNHYEMCSFAEYSRGTK